MNVPHLRFKGFSGVWKAVKIDSVLDRISNPVEVKKDEFYQEIGIRSHGRGLFHKELITATRIYHS